MAEHRASGILLHITSLPGRFGIGDFGPAAYRFADFLARAEQKLWQLLPLVPAGHGHSPYSSPSTFAINPLLISPELLKTSELLSPDEIEEYPDLSASSVDFRKVTEHKSRLLRSAYRRFEENGRPDVKAAFDGFCRQEAAWLDDYARFMAIRSQEGGRQWTDWPEKYRTRGAKAMRKVDMDLREIIDMHRFWQFVAAEQWNRLRGYCNERGIRIIGDIPIYVAHDSADVWANPELFELNPDGLPSVVAGVPPDYFSETGQRWGNPLYRWDLMERDGFEWWVRRLRSTLAQVDLVRLDHFRGFEAYWEVPASERTAEGGRWVKGPGARLFDILESRLGSMPIIAEDLGLITEEVVALMRRYGFPGMAVLQFAFDTDADDKFLPHNYHRNLVAYTGTHDNDTVRGWYRGERSTQDEDQVRQARAFCREYLGVTDNNLRDLHWLFIRSLSASVADRVVFPLQDILGLGAEARMNIPGEATGNWSWRFEESQLTKRDEERLRRMTVAYGRGRAHAPRSDAGGSALERGV